MGREEEAVAVLAALVAEQALTTRAMEVCRAALRNLAEEEAELGLRPLRGWPVAEIELRFDSCAVVVRHGLLPYPFLDTRIGLYVADGAGVHFQGRKKIGTYRRITLLDGTAEDDYLAIDVPNSD